MLVLIVQCKCKTYIYDNSSRDNWHHLEDLSRWHAIIYRVDKCSSGVQTSSHDCLLMTSPFSQNRRPDTAIQVSQWYFLSLFFVMSGSCKYPCLIAFRKQSYVGSYQIYSFISCPACAVSVLSLGRILPQVSTSWEYRWSFLLQDVKVLKLSYNYSEDENEVLRYFV